MSTTKLSPILLSKPQYSNQPLCHSCGRYVPVENLDQCLCCDEFICGLKANHCSGALCL
jgi:hypothetical protein